MLKNKKKFLVSMALSLVLMSSSVPALATTIQDTNTNQEVSTESTYNLKDLNEHY